VDAAAIAAAGRHDPGGGEALRERIRAARVAAIAALPRGT
jgi:hypothetical protein